MSQAYFQCHLDELAARDEQSWSSEGPVLLWVPSADIGFHSVVVPKVKAAKRQAMLKWALEDQLLSDPDDLHLVVGPALDEQHSLCLSIPKSTMARWVNMIAASGARVVSMVPDCLALPWDPDSGDSVFPMQTHLLVRTGEYTGFSAEQPLAWALLQNAATRGDTEDKAYRFNWLAEAEPDVPQSLEYLHHPSQISWAFADYPRACNLLVGEYRPRRSHSALTPWKPALIAAAVCGVLLVTAASADYWRLGRDIPSLQGYSVAVYQSLFNERPTVDTSLLRREASARIQQQQVRYIATQTGVLPLVEALDLVLSSCRECQIKSLDILPERAILIANDNPQLRRALNTMLGWQARIDQTEGVISVEITPDAVGGQ